jgi:hypothetical protein
MRLRRQDNLVTKRFGILFCYSDVPDSTMKCKQMESLLIDKL